MDLPLLYHTPLTIPASVYHRIYTTVASIHLPQALCLVFLPFLYPSFSFFTIVTPLHYPLIFFWLSFFCFPHSFISALLALMSVAMARSIQDGVFVLSTERKMNVAAMHHSLLNV